MKLLNQTEWDQYIEAHPEAHLLQTSAWGELKRAFGWLPVRLLAGESAAQVLFRRLPLGISAAYLPKALAVTDWDALLPALDQLCRQQRAVFLTIEPDLLEPLDPALLTRLDGFGTRVEPIQPRRTLLIDLTGTEADWLARMSKKTRHAFEYGIQNGVSVAYSTEIEAFISLMQQTGERAGFGVHSPDYYRHVFQLFAPQNKAALLLARREGRNLAGLMLFRHGTRAYYLYGASSGEDRQFNPTYLIQLESMRWAAQNGCTTYDLWGVPDVNLETLETQFTTRKDGLWGVYGYKRKFGGQLARTAGAWRKVYNPALFNLYQLWSRLRRGDAA